VTSFEFCTESSSSRGFRMAFGLFVAALAGAASMITAVQWLARQAGEELKTSPWAIVPGVLIVAWGATVGTKKERVVVDPKARTLAWIVTAFGIPYRVVKRAWSDVTEIQVLPNSRLQSRGWRADVTGPLGRITVFHYFHRRPPKEIVELAKLLGVPLTEKK
jgi:hypothetical protein